MPLKCRNCGAEMSDYHVFCTQCGQPLDMAGSDPSPAPAPKSAPGFSLGDRVKHKAFGSGVIVKMTPMGGDYLIEINFEQIGIKKLMLRAAAQHMTELANS